MLERLPRPLRAGVDIGAETYRQWIAHRTIRLGAGLAYYALFAIIPTLALALALAGRVVSDLDVQSYLDERLQQVFGPDAGGFSQQVADRLGADGTIAGLGVIGAVSLLLAASLVVLSLQDALNTVWEMPVRPGFRRSLLRRLLAIAVILGAGVVLIAGFVVNSITAMIASVVPDVVVLGSLTELFGLVSSWLIAVVVIVLLFRYLPDARAPWHSAIVGGSLTTLFVAVGTSAIGFYLRNFAGSSVAGVAGGAVLLLVWLYYEAQIILAGAEFTRVLALRRL